MTLADILAGREASLAAATSARSAATATQESILAGATAEGRTNLNADEQARFDAATADKRTATENVATLTAGVESLRAEMAEDAAVEARAAIVVPGAVAPGQRTAVVGETRTYGRGGADVSRREVARNAQAFLSDVARSSHFNDFAAQARLAQHMVEERTERADWFADQERAGGTAAFSGLVVPQYLVDLVAPNAKAGRPLADAMNTHPLPETGMTLNISKITTGTSVTVQAAEGNAAADVDIDDTLLPVSVQTASGQQTLSRQAVERGVGTDEILLQDLARAYATTLDSTLINQAVTGLAAIAGANVAYTDGTPTAAELYPKILDAASRVEAGLLSFGSVDIAVMHSRRWFWLQSQLSTSWPLFGQPNLGVQQGGLNYGEKYGSGFRGLLPNGIAVVVDNNISTVLGAGTEDEIYFGCSDEMHLWEDPSAPVFIRTEEVKAATLQILFVLYGYFGYTHARFSAGTAKVSGTGLIAPTF